MHTRKGKVQQDEKLGIVLNFAGREGFHNLLRITFCKPFKGEAHHPSIFNGSLSFGLCTERGEENIWLSGKLTDMFGERMVDDDDDDDDEKCWTTSVHSPDYVTTNRRIRSY